MTSIPFVDIHTHPFRNDADIVTVQNVYPGDGFAAFNGRNYYSVGVHPWHIGDEEENDEALRMLKKSLNFDHVIFIGEAGLDKIIDNDFAEQKRLFEAQAVLAEESKLPMLIHCVRACNDILELRKKINPAMPWIMHGFNGNKQMAEQLQKEGIRFSFGANLLRENSKAAKTFKDLPLDKIFFETDEMESNVERIYEQGAKLKDIDINELKSSVWDNFKELGKIIS